MIRHVIMWKFREGEEENMHRFLNGLKALDGVIPEIRRMEVGVNVLEKNNYDACLIADFDDLEALERSRRLRLPDGSQVVLRSIRYAASDGHRVTLHCKDGDRTLRTSFAAVEPLLCAYPCFCGICRGVVVNFHEVAGRQEDVFLLKDGTRLPISRRRLREVQEAYSAFRFDRLRKDGVD